MKPLLLLLALLPLSVAAQKPVPCGDGVTVTGNFSCGQKPVFLKREPVSNLWTISVTGELRVFDYDGNRIMVCPAKGGKISGCKVTEGHTLDEAMQILTDWLKSDDDNLRQCQKTLRFTVSTIMHSDEKPAPKPSKEKQP